jgi:hypothetical protein
LTGRTDEPLALKQGVQPVEVTEEPPVSRETVKVAPMVAQHMPDGKPRGALRSGKGEMPLSKGKVAELRETLRGKLSDEGMAHIDTLLAAPRSLKVECPKCHKVMYVDPPASDDLRMKVLEFLGKYSVGTRHEEEKTDRYVLIMDV